MKEDAPDFQPIEPHAADTTPLPMPGARVFSSESDVELRRLKAFQKAPSPTSDKRESDPDGVLRPLEVPVTTPVPKKEG